MINSSISSAESTKHVYYSIIRTALTNLLDKPAGQVLEIGCGTGETLSYLKKMGAVEVTGIELRPEVAKAAEDKDDIDFVYNCNFLGQDSPVKGKAFDTIILSHVLEHFTEPELVLKEIKKLMKSDGTLLLAVPNVRHVSVTVPLLLHGSFEYTESGVLDNTHFRFYTKKSIEKLLRSNGFRIEKSEMDFAGPRASTVNTLTLGMLSEFLGFAVNISAKRSLP